MQKKSESVRVKSGRVKEYIACDHLDQKDRVIGREYKQELIRCRDCDHFDPRPYDDGFCWGVWGMFVPDDGWCFKADHREESE